MRNGRKLRNGRKGRNRKNCRSIQKKIEQKLEEIKEKEKGKRRNGRKLRKGRKGRNRKNCMNGRGGGR